MIRYRVSHTTRYRYTDTVSLCHNQAHLLPRYLPRQRYEQAQLVIRPEPTVCHERSDFFGNRVVYFAIQEPHDTLEVTANSEVVIVPADLPDFDDSLAWETVRNLLRHDSRPDIQDARFFVLESPFVPLGSLPTPYAAVSFTPGRSLLAAALDLTHRIHSEFAYTPQSTTVATPLAEVFTHRRGVCQDFAHLAIACLRSLGLAARYVSGYVETVPPLGQTPLAGADASHAWLAVYTPDYGWVDFDPTNNQAPTDRHITVAWGRDYGDVTPLKGVVLGGSGHELEVAVTVQRQEDVKREDASSAHLTTSS